MSNEHEVQKRVQEEISKFLDNPQNVIEAYQKQLKIVEAEKNELIPKADFYDSVTQSDDWIDMSTAVKSMDYAGKPIGRNKMFSFLRDRGILRSNNEPYQKYVDREYFRIVEIPWTNQNGETWIGRITVVSQKGLDFLIKLVNEAHSE